MLKSSKISLKKSTTLLLTSCVAVVVGFGGVTSASENVQTYPNIFRAFDDNINGIGGISGIDGGQTSAFDLPNTQSDISRLPMVDREATLWGEFDYISWPLFVTQADLRDKISVDLVFQNAASVMPENSALELLVNGVKLAQATIQNPGSPGTLSVEIPGSALAAGYNAITVIARQHHRVDCSADATYELWTRIDMKRSVVTYAGNKNRVNSLRDLAGVAADVNQALPIRLHYPDIEPYRPESDRSRAYFSMAQKAAIVRGLRKTDVKIASASTVRMHEPALDLFTGAVSELNATPSLSRLYDFSDVATLVNSASTNTVYVASRDKRRTLMLRPREIAHLPDEFESYMSNPFVGSKQGISVAQSAAYQTYEDTTVSLRELGFLENEFIGRRFNAKFGFRLPADFFPGAYDEIALHLFGAHVEGLKQGQRMLIRINGQSEISLPLNSRRAGVFEDKIVQLELARFKPGFNEIEIVAYVEMPSDDTCVPGDSIDPTPRFFLSGDSFLSIPKLAHLGRFPNVDATVNSGFPYRTEDGRGSIDVVLSDDRPATMGKAVDFIAAMAAQTDYVFDIRPSLPSSVSQNGFASNRVIVGAYNALPQEYATAIKGANINAIASYWNNPNLIADANVDTMKTAALGDSQSFDLSPGAVGLPSGSNVNLLGNDVAGQSGISMRERFQRQAQERRETSAFWLFFDKVATFVTKPLRAFQKEAVAPVYVADSASAVLGQVVEGDILTTVVGYAETGNASAPIDGFFMPGRIQGDLVETAGLQLTDNAVTSVKASIPQLSMITNYSFRNVRLIIAGWFSNNPAVYGVLTLLAFLVAGIVSHLALNRTARVADDTYETLEFK